MQGVVKGLIESAPKHTRTFRDLARAQMAGQFLTGSAEQVADALQSWHEAGVDGFNLVYAVTPGGIFRATLESDLALKPGENLTLSPRPDRVRWFDPETTQALPV